MLIKILILACFFHIVYGTSSQYGYQIKWYENMPVDHFAFVTNNTFNMRYLINDTYFKKGGPIFFYCGNEANVEKFVHSAGFMYDNAPSFNALILFAEHRYYGETQPFGNESLTNLNIGYLSAEQVLADYAIFLRWIKRSYQGASRSPVIAFGGSYGGMLSAWIRIKYPHVVKGAIASSAPILQFTGVTDCSAYATSATSTYRRSGYRCDEFIKKAIPTIRKVFNTTDGPNKLGKIFRICPDVILKDQKYIGDDLIKWMYLAFVYLAMFDYPYPASVLKPLPAWPVKAACSHMTNPDTSDEELLSSVAEAISVYLNYTGQLNCYSFSEVTTGGSVGWYYQTCTELVFPMCNKGSMFEESTWDLKKTSDNCYRRFKVRPRENWIMTEYGTNKLFAASNIIFTNGDLDPWFGSGVHRNYSDTVISLVIKDGAHHYDLCGQHEDDTQYVKDVRNIEVEYIKKWIEQYHQKK